MSKKGKKCVVMLFGMGERGRQKAEGIGRRDKGQEGAKIREEQEERGSGFV